MGLSRKRAIAGAAQRSPKAASLLNKPLNALMDGVCCAQSELILIGTAECQTGIAAHGIARLYSAAGFRVSTLGRRFPDGPGRHQVRVNRTEVCGGETKFAEVTESFRDDRAERRSN
jgi:hypothetical protein